VRKLIIIIIFKSSLPEEKVSSSPHILRVYVSVRVELITKIAASNLWCMPVRIGFLNLARHRFAVHRAEKEKIF